MAQQNLDFLAKVHRGLEHVESVVRGEGYLATTYKGRETYYNFDDRPTIATHRKLVTAADAHAGKWDNSKILLHHRDEVAGYGDPWVEIIDTHISPRDEACAFSQKVEASLDRLKAQLLAELDVLLPHAKPRDADLPGLFKPLEKIVDDYIELKIAGQLGFDIDAGQGRTVTLWVPPHFAFFIDA